MTTANASSSHACAAVIVAGHQSCFALKRNGLHPVLATASPQAIPAGVGYGPSQLRSAYNLTAASAAKRRGPHHRDRRWTPPTSTTQAS